PTCALPIYIAGGDRTRTRGVEGNFNLVLAVDHQGHALQVEQNLDDVCADALEGAVLVLDTVDFHLSDGKPRHGGKQNPAQCITQGVTEATLQWLENNFGAVYTEICYVDSARCQQFSRRRLHRVTCVMYRM